MSTTIIANSAEALVGLVGFGAFFFAAVALFRPMLLTYGKTPKSQHSYIPRNLTTYLSYTTCLILVLVCLSTCLLFYHAAVDSQTIFDIAFYMIFTCVVAITLISSIVFSWVLTVEKHDTTVASETQSDSKQLLEEDFVNLKGIRSAESGDEQEGVEEKAEEGKEGTDTKTP